MVVDKPDAVQTEIRMGHIGIRRKTNDFMAVDLATRILGGEGANRLYRVLRAERGLTYARRGRFRHAEDVGRHRRADQHQARDDRRSRCG